MSIKKEKNKQKKPNHLPKPIEVKVADTIFLKMRNNMVLFKDLTNPKVHYSGFIIGSKFDFHVTQENQVNSKKKHVQLRARLVFEGSSLDLVIHLRVITAL